MLIVLKSAAIAACLVLVVLWTVGRVFSPVGASSPAPVVQEFVPPSGTGSVSSSAPACSYDGNFDNDVPGCR